MDNSTERSRRRRIATELVLILVGTVFVFFVAFPLLRGSKTPAEFFHDYRRFGVDEALAMAALISLAGSLFALDRWNDANRDRERLQAAEQRLQESEVYYRLLFDNARDAQIVEDMNEHIVDANPAASAMFGYSREELLTMSTRQLQPGDGGGPILPIYRQPDQYPSMSRMAQGMRRDGSDMPLEISMTAYRAGGRQLFLSIVRDVSERQRAEEALRAERDRSQRYLDVAGVMLVVLGTDERVVLINRKGADVLGRPEHEIVGHNWTDNFVPLRERDRIHRVCADLFAGQDVGLEYNENHVLTADGRERVIAWHNVTLRDEAGQVTGLLSSGEDVTEQRLLEDQLRQAHKMEAIGQLAGGVAHEFNNLLQVINGYSEFALEALRSEDPAYADITQVRAAGARAAELTQQLLAFSRRQERRPRTIELSDSLEEIAKMLRPFLGEDVTLHLHVSEDVGSVRADVAQLSQALINLAVNGRDAIRAAGRPGVITIEASNADLDEATAHAMGIQPGSYVRVSVADTGTGMSAAVLEHIYEPFFTTKRVGQGTGLGLSAVYGIIRQSAGSIQVQSEVSKGTTFVIYLPRVAIAENVLSEPGNAYNLPAGTETILVVEDDGGVRELVARLLVRLGYNVVEAAAGQEAIDLYQALLPRPDLLLTDVLLPDRAGTALAAELQQRGHAVRAVFMTGHAPVGLSPDLPQGATLLAKPFTAAELAYVVRAALDQPV
ncbi:MAG: PAS domain S-box protein [Chloroflexi bacterium]|nr:PAS domain S-box protein [Chloroflexota bacterium]